MAKCPRTIPFRAVLSVMYWPNRVISFRAVKCHVLARSGNSIPRCLKCYVLAHSGDYIPRCKVLCAGPFEQNVIGQIHSALFQVLCAGPIG
jgi:hypothetical protein